MIKLTTEHCPKCGRAWDETSEGYFCFTCGTEPHDKSDPLEPLDRIEAACDAAPDPPWRGHADNGETWETVVTGAEDGQRWRLVKVIAWQPAPVVEFIVLSRTALPVLVKGYRRLLAATDILEHNKGQPEIANELRKIISEALKDISK